MSWLDRSDDRGTSNGEKVEGWLMYLAILATIAMFVVPSGALELVAVALWVGFAWLLRTNTR